MAGAPPATVKGTVLSSKLIRTRRPGFTIFEAILDDGTGSLRLVFFNQPYLARVLTAGRSVWAFGSPELASRSRHGLVLQNPQYETEDEADEMGRRAARPGGGFGRAAGASREVGLAEGGREGRQAEPRPHAGGKPVRKAVPDFVEEAGGEAASRPGREARELPVDRDDPPDGERIARPVVGLVLRVLDHEAAASA